MSNKNDSFDIYGSELRRSGIGLNTNKLCLLGPSAVGKSSIAVRFI